MHRTSGEIIRAHNMTDRQVVRGDDGDDLGAEVGRPPVQRGEIVGDDAGGHHRDDGGRTPERQGTGRASSHDGSFPVLSGTRRRPRADRSEGRKGKWCGDYDDFAPDVDESAFFFDDEDDEDDESPFDFDDPPESLDPEPDFEELPDSDFELSDFSEVLESDLVELPLRFPPLRLSFL
jgi:hypothetical protein